jgi:hypothetical protein
MNKITFILSLVSASLTVTVASAAVQSQNEVVTLPAYSVTAPRYTDAEKAVASSLAELRAKAQPALTVRTELPSLNTIAKQPTATQDERSLATKVSTVRHTRS